MTNITIKGKEYPAELNMLGLIELEKLYDGDLNEFMRSVTTGKNQLVNSMKFLFAVVNTTAVANNQKRPFPEFEQFCIAMGGVKDLQTIIASIYTEGMASTSKEDDQAEHDVFLEEERAEESLKNV